MVPYFSALLLYYYTIIIFILFVLSDWHDIFIKKLIFNWCSRMKLYWSICSLKYILILFSYYSNVWLLHTFVTFVKTYFRWESLMTLRNYLPSHLWLRERMKSSTNLHNLSTGTRPWVWICFRFTISSWSELQSKYGISNALTVRNSVSFAFQFLFYVNDIVTYGK